MARKTDVVRIPGWGGRDCPNGKGKMFLITEWPAARAELWAIKALLAYNRNGGQIPIEMVGRGMEAIGIIGVNIFLTGHMKHGEVMPILDELLECVKIIRDEKARDALGAVVATEMIDDQDIEEIQTRLWLRSEVLRVHTGFSVAASLYDIWKKSEILLAALAAQNSPTPPTSPL